MMEEERSYLRQAVPVMEDRGRPYSVRIDTVPMPWRRTLHDHIQRELVPVFNDGVGDCTYAWDWDDRLSGSPVLPVLTR